MSKNIEDAIAEAAQFEKMIARKERNAFLRMIGSPQREEFYSTANTAQDTDPSKIKHFLQHRRKLLKKLGEHIGKGGHSRSQMEYKGLLSRMESAMQANPADLAILKTYLQRATDPADILYMEGAVKRLSAAVGDLDQLCRQYMANNLLTP